MTDNKPVFVYVLKSEVHWWFYVGMTENLEERIERHNRGYEFATKPYAPFRLVIWFTCDSRGEARLLERYLKSGSGKEYIKRHWQNNFGR